MLNYQEKNQIINNLIKTAKESKAIYFVNFSGLKSDKINNLRRELKKQNIIFKTTKKTLAEIALRNIGFNGKFKKHSNDILALNFVSGDILSAAKSLWSFHRQNNLVFKIIGGFLDGSFINENQVEKLAKMPPKEILLGQLVGSFALPIQKLNWSLKSNLQKLVFVLKQIKK